MAGLFEGNGGAGSSEMRLAMARIDALEHMVLSMTREHMALAAGVEGRLAAIESTLKDAGLADSAKKTPPGGGGDAVAFKHEYAPSSQRTERIERAGVTANAQHLVDIVREELASPRDEARDRVKALLLVLDRYADAHDGLCAICGEYHGHHLSTCWKRIFNAPAT